MGLLLTSITDLLELTPSSTSVLNIQASWVDLSGSTVTPGRTNTIYSTASITTIVGSPAASTQRVVEFLSVQNLGATETITITHTDGTNAVQVQKILLPAGYTFVYNEGSGWTLYDSNGNIQTSIGPGRFLKRTIILNGTTTFTTLSATNTIIARMVAAGGQGGGCSATAGCVGSGGGSGSYAELVAAVSGSTAYTCAVGAGGSTGGTGANGQAGANTTLTIGATTTTCNGGGGGVNGAAINPPVLGGAGGTVSTNGTLNVAGNPGEPSAANGTAANNRSGQGASSQFGAGGASLLEAGNATGNAATNYGSGGGGAATSAATARAGGTGSPGVLIIDEYS